MRRLLALLSLALAQPATAAIGDNSVGINVHDGRQDFIDACVDLGVAWVRLDANWWVIQDQSASSANWGYLDDAVDAARAAGLEVFISLGYTPSWVPRRDNGDGWHGNDLPTSSTEWVNFVTLAVNRYKDRVAHYGMWNETNLEGFLDASPAEYWSVIAAPGAAAVHAACGTCKALGPELAHVGEVDVYLEDFFAQPAINGVAPVQAFDIVTHHSYQSFPELGVDIWDGDRFFNVLDQQRFTWPVASRRSLRQVLDDAGYAGEVWITETGYRATVDDAQDEQNQATYLTLVLEEQLARDWYTNTFFYEIYDCRPDQPDCDIDGFGLMRATSGTPGNRSFPASYRLKPAFTALKAFILSHPEITGQGARPACSDGADNDQDGRVDLADRGCASALDEDEGDDPSRRRLQALRTPGLVVDGDLADVGAEGWVALGASDWVGSEGWGGAQDCAVRAAARWDDGALYLAVEVSDDVHHNDHVPAELWQGDSLQLAFDLGQSGGQAYDAVDDHEINVARVAASTSSYRFHGPAAASDGWSAQVARAGCLTRYELRLPPAVLPGLALTAGTVIGFSFLVNDDDGGGRTGWLELTPGIGQAKVPELFGEIALVATSSGGSTDAGAGVDQGLLDAGRADSATAADRGPGADASAAADASARDAGAGGDGSGAGDAAARDLANTSDAAVVDEPAAGCGCRAGAGLGSPAWLGALVVRWGLRRWRGDRRG